MFRHQQKITCLQSPSLSVCLGGKVQYRIFILFVRKIHQSNPRLGKTLSLYETALIRSVDVKILLIYLFIYMVSLKLSMVVRTSARLKKKL